MLVHFRERIGGELINKINRKMVENNRESQGADTTAKKPENEAEEPRKNRGKLIVDASCAPADISYPTDLNLLNQVRKHTEQIIDTLYKSVKGKLKKKPRTSRKLARKSYLEVAKKRNPRAKTRRKAIKKQLQYIQRNLGYIEQAQIEAYHEYTGYYPESVHVDKIYRTRANRAWCQERGIRMSGPPLGRPPKHISKEQKRQAQQDERIRNHIEGFFGQGKRRFSLARVMTKLASTSFCAIAITFFIINLSHLLRQVLSAFLCLKLKNSTFWRLMIIFNYHLIMKQQQRLMFTAT
jgi:hypothetical protein